MRFHIVNRSRTVKYNRVDGKEIVSERKHNLAYYICRGIKDYPHMFNCRKPKQLLCDGIESLVWRKVDDVLRNPKVMEVAIQAHADRVQEEIADESQYMERVKATIGKARLEEQWLITQARKGQITEEQMALQMKAVREEREVWERELQKIEQARLLRGRQKDILEQAKEVCSKLMSRLDHLAVGEAQEVRMQKRAILRLLLNKVTVDRDGRVNIEFGVPEVSDSSGSIVAFDTSSSGLLAYHQ